MDSIEIVPLSKVICRADWNMRSDDEDVSTLMDSIQRSGQLHPIIVNAKYEIIAGFRRHRAISALGHPEIQVKVVTDESEDSERLIHLDENLERKDFTVAKREEALSEKHRLYKKLVAAGVKDPSDFERETIAQTGLSKTAIFRGVQRHANASDETWESFRDEEIGTVQLDEMIKLPKKTQDKILPKVRNSSAAETRSLVNEELAKINIPADVAIKHSQLGTITPEKYMKTFTKEWHAIMDSMSALLTSGGYRKLAQGDERDNFFAYVNDLHSMVEKVQRDINQTGE